MPPIRTMACGLFLCTAHFALTDQASAALTYQYVTDQANYDLNPGQSVSVNLYLRESFDGGDSPLLASGGEGLFGAGIQVLRQTGPSDPASITGLTGNTAEFDDLTTFNNPSLTSFTAGQAKISLAVSTFGDKVTFTSAGSGYYDLLIGSVTVLAGLVPSEVTSFDLLDRGTTDDVITATNLNVLDPLISQGGFTVTVLPEPAAMGLLSLGAVLLLPRRRPVR